MYAILGLHKNRTSGGSKTSGTGQSQIFQLILLLLNENHYSNIFPNNYNILMKSVKKSHNYNLLSLS